MASISTVPETLFEVSKLANQPRLATESIAGQRPYQEDNVLAKSLDDGRTLVAVADGMGGHAAGDVASALAMETLVDAIEAGQSLSSAFTLANSAVHTKSREPGKQGMGTTLVAALVDGGEFHVANVGDSRCYLMTGDGIQQLSEDHSFVAEAMKRGQSEEEALTSKFKDATVFSFNYGSEPTMDIMRSINGLHSCNSFTKWTCIPDLQPTIDAANSEFDPAKRRVLLKKIAQTYHDEAASLFLFDSVDLDAVKSYVKDYKPVNRLINWKDVRLEGKSG